MQWATSHSGWFFVAAAIALLAVLGLARRTATSPSARGFGLLLIRSLVLALLLVIIANPVQVSEARLPPRNPSAITLFDASRSMGLESPLTRTARAEIAATEAERSLPASSAVRMSRFQFGDQVLPLAGPAQPLQERSQILAALESLPARFGEDLPRGIFLYSDGRSTETVNADLIKSIAEGYKALEVPIHVFPVGDPEAAGDVGLRDVVAPRDVPPGTKVPIKVVVGSFGLKGERAEIQIRSESAPQGPTLATLPITLADEEQTFDLTVEADRANGRLLIEVPPRAHEAFVRNNRVSVPLSTRNPKVRVIYMEGTLSNEYTWIRDALVEDPNIECLALEVNAQYASIPTLHRVTDPSRGFPTTREELFGYDVIICSDINRNSFTQEQLDWVVELVGERGGGFIMIGGNTSFGAGFWDQTVWDGLISVDMSGRAQGYGTIWNVSFKPSVPADQQSHPIWKIVDDPVKNAQILQNIPYFYGTNRTDRVKPGAIVLAYSDQPVSDAGIMPIMTCQTFGKGRTFAFSPDSTVDWGRDFERLWGEGDNRYFRKFWRNVVRWLAENSAGQNRRLRVSTDKLLYRPGEPIALQVQAYDENQKPTADYRVISRLLRPQPPQRPGQLVPTPLSPDTPLTPRPSDLTFEAQLETPSLDRVPLLGGDSATRTVVVETTAYKGSEVVSQSTSDIQLLDDSPEFHDPRPDPALLEQLASQSGGKVLRSGQDVAEVLQTYKSVQGDSAVYKVPIWDRAWLWLSIIGLLTLEWIIRRATGLA